MLSPAICQLFVNCQRVTYLFFKSNDQKIDQTWFKKKFPSWKKKVALPKRGRNLIKLYKFYVRLLLDLRFNWTFNLDSWLCTGKTHWLLSWRLNILLNIQDCNSVRISSKDFCSQKQYMGHQYSRGIILL